MTELIVTDLEVHAPDGRVLLHPSSATFALGESHAVVGRSGAGKSVFFKAVVGLLPAVQGTVTLGAHTATAQDPSSFVALRRQIAFVHQEPALLDDRSVEENLIFVLKRRRERVREGRLFHWLEVLQLTDVRHALPRTLPPGVLRRAALARALCLAPEVLVADEPTTGLDPSAAADVDDALRLARDDGTTVVVVTHDRRSLQRQEPRLTWVERGRVRWQGRPGSTNDAAPPGLRALLAGEPLPADDAGVGL